MKPSQKINKSAPSERQEQAETEKLCSLLPINDTLSKLQDQTETKNGWKQQVSPSKWMWRGVEGTKVKGEMWKFIPAGYISPGSLFKKKYLHVDVTNSVAQL